jgi:hypothetical protein
MSREVGTVIAQITIALRTIRDALKKAKAFLEGGTHPPKKASVEGEALKAVSRIMRMTPRGIGRKSITNGEKNTLCPTN